MCLYAALIQHVSSYTESSRIQKKEGKKATSSSYYLVGATEVTDTRPL